METIAQGIIWFCSQWWFGLGSFILLIVGLVFMHYDISPILVWKKFKQKHFNKSSRSKSKQP